MLSTVIGFVISTLGLYGTQEYPHLDSESDSRGYYVLPARTCNCDGAHPSYAFYLQLADSVTFDGNCVSGGVADGWCHLSYSWTLPNEALKSFSIPQNYCLVRVRVELQGTPAPTQCPPGPCPTGTSNVTSHICHGQFEPCTGNPDEIGSGNG